MHNNPIDEESRAGLVRQFKAARRHEAIFEVLAVLLIVLGLFAYSYLNTAAGVGLGLIGGTCALAALEMNIDRQSKRKNLPFVGPAAIGPLIEEFYYQQSSDTETVGEARTQTAATIVKLLGTASRQHLLNLTSKEAECLYKTDANWTDGCPEHQLVVLNHLIACLDTRAIPWVLRLINTPSLSKHSKEVMQRALICHDLLMAKYTREKTSSVLMRATHDSSPLLRPATGSNTDGSKADSILVRPSPHE